MFLLMLKTCGPDLEQRFQACVEHRLTSPSGLGSLCSESGPHRPPSTVRSEASAIYNVMTGPAHHKKGAPGKSACSVEVPVLKQTDSKYRKCKCRPDIIA